MAEYVDKNDVCHVLREALGDDSALGQVVFTILESTIRLMPLANADEYGLWLVENDTAHRCSRCKSVVHDRPEPNRCYPYCPHCGAKMEW